MYFGSEFSNRHMEVHLGRTREWEVIVGAAINSGRHHPSGRSMQRLLISSLSEYCYGRDELPEQRPISMILTHCEDFVPEVECGQCTLYWQQCADAGISHLMGLFLPHSTVTELEIIGNSCITSIGFDTILSAADRLPNLSSICLANCPKIGSLGLEAMGKRINCLRHLRYIRIAGCSERIDGLSELFTEVGLVQCFDERLMKKYGCAVLEAHNSYVKSRFALDIVCGTYPNLRLSIVERHAQMYFVVE
jgi:hypothetical protein